MREIKFRGKSKLSIEELDLKEMKHTDGWIIGNLIVNGNLPLIVGDLVDYDEEYITHEQWCSVHPETVGQYTGLIDNNGTEIYEGDIVDYMTMRYEVVFRNQAFGWIEDIEFIPFANMAQCQLPNLEVIGNLYENPELPENE